MSKFDRVNVGALRPCCIAAVHGRAELAADGAMMTCAACGGLIVLRDGMWTRGREGVNT